MRCEEIRTVMDDPEWAGKSPQTTTVQSHLEDCSRCADLDRSVRRALDAYRDQPPAPLSLEAWSRLKIRVDRDWNATAVPSSPSLPAQNAEIPMVVSPVDGYGLPGLHSSPARSAASGGKGLAGPAIGTGHPRLFRVRGPAALVGVGLMLVLGLAGLYRMDPPGPVRFKGPSPSNQVLSVDVLPAVERVRPNGSTHLLRAEDGMQLTRQDGIIFRFSVEGGSFFTLVERSPNHHLKVLYQVSDLRPDRNRPVVVDILAESRRPMRYVPDGPAGEYTYLAVVSHQPFAPAPENLDSLWARYVADFLATGREPVGPESESGDGELAVKVMRFDYQPETDAP